MHCRNGPSLWGNYIYFAYNEDSTYQNCTRPNTNVCPGFLKGTGAKCLDAPVESAPMIQVIEFSTRKGIQSVIQQRNRLSLAMK